MTFSIWRWLSGLPRQRPDLHVILYSRTQCPLCGEAWKLLCAHQKRWGFVLETIEIDGSPELVREHGNCVPVVTVNGRVRFRGHVNEVLLKRILDARPDEPTT